MIERHFESLNTASIKQQSALLLDKGRRNLSQLSDLHITLGITGLRRTGKSTFITSLLSQFEAIGRQGGVDNSRVLACKITFPPQQAFPYQDNVDALVHNQPSWPQPTRDVTSCTIELKMKPEGASWRSLLGQQSQRIFLHLFDYPGEWLLDLPLLSQSFVRFSGYCNSLYSHGVRHELMGPLYQTLAAIDPFEPCDLTQLEQLSQQYRQFLLACKNSKENISIIQPGQFITEPSPLSQDDWFIPLLGLAKYEQAQLDRADKSSWYGVLKARYRHYKQHYVEPFYQKHFSQIDKQIVLVDPLTAIDSSKEAVEDLRQAISTICDAFHYGKKQWLLDFFKPRVDKVWYCATKADRVISDDHDNLALFTQDLVHHAYLRAAFKGIDTDYLVTSAIRASKEITRGEGQAISARDNLSAEPIGYVHPTVPNSVANLHLWEKPAGWSLPKLAAPPKLSPPFTHIRMDSLVQKIIDEIV